MENVAPLVLLNGHLVYFVINGIFSRFAVYVVPRKSWQPWDRCYDFLNIFAEKFSKKIGVFDSK
jgi:hypothetical protein